MKLNRLYSFVIVMLITKVVAAQGLNNSRNTITEVIVLKVDTIHTNGHYAIRNYLKCGNKSIILTNKFLERKGTPSTSTFNLKNYLGLEVEYKRKVLSKFISFDKRICDYTTPFIEDFKGDSIDNEFGFKCLNLSTYKHDYLLLRGFFNGCNGSFCNNGVILVLNFSNNELAKGYVIGIDKSLYDLSKIKLQKGKKDVQLKIRNEDGHYITLLLKDEAILPSKPIKNLSQGGLFCIQ
ncbi:MAG: hypothetical protein V4592_16115 [Bacteroidota bacterium]